MKNMNLYSYDQDDFAALEALKQAGRPKWNHTVESYMLGLPVDNAVAFCRGDDDAALGEKAGLFAAAARARGAETATLRFDVPRGGRRTSSSLFWLDKPETIAQAAREALNSGVLPFAASFYMRRVEKRGTAVVAFLSNGRVAIEMVGSGYDASDLSKGIVTPPVRITMKAFAPDLEELAEAGERLPLYLDIYDEAKDEGLSAAERVEKKARRLAARLKFLADFDKVSAAEKERELREKGQTGMFDGRVDYSLASIVRLLKNAAIARDFWNNRGKSAEGETLAFYRNRAGRYILDNKWNYKYGR